MQCQTKFAFDTPTNNGLPWPTELQPLQFDSPEEERELKTLIVSFLLDCDIEEKKRLRGRGKLSC